MNQQPEALRIAAHPGTSDAASAALRRQHAEIEALQAKIDSLMLEYCPNDMSTDQMRAWELAQRQLTADDVRRVLKIDAARDVKP